jgi:hypothetical protein
MGIPSFVATVTSSKRQIVIDIFKWSATLVTPGSCPRGVFSFLV